MHVCFDVSQGQKYDGVSRFFLPFLVKALFAKTLIFLKNSNFLFHLSWKGQIVTYGCKTGYGWIQTGQTFRLPLLRSTVAIRG